jgi:excisionase family DNA binding protein
MNTEKLLPLVLTVRETSRLLDLSRYKVYLLIEAKAVDAFKVGADWRIRSASVKPLLATVPNTSGLESRLEFIEGTTN